MVGNFTITDESNLFTSSSVEKPTISNAMNTIKSGQPSVLSYGQLKLLKSTYGGFSEIRIKCRKPSTGRTVHIVLTNEHDFVNNVMYGSFTSESTLNKGIEYRQMSDDNSVIGDSSTASATLSSKIYEHVIFISSLSHVQIAHTNRLECDDYSNISGFQNAGNWQYFIR